jgi:serine protease Do
MRPRERKPSTRRALLSAVGTTAVVSLAGCVASSIPRRSADDAANATTTHTATATPAGEDSYSEATLRHARQTGVAVRDSVVAMSPRPPQISGTGWYFGSENQIVTAGHVVVARDGWVAWQPDGTKLDPTYVDDAYVDGADVGAMRTEVPGPPLTPGSTDDLEPGQPLVQVGHPSGVGNWVIALGRYLGETDTEADGFLSSIPSEGGASGSPTVTLDGEVVGLLSGGEFVEDSPQNATETASTTVYGPDDHPERAEHVGIDAITDWIERWTDAR